ncbi:hypothetical protein [Luteibacter sp.]|jgi:hypothetical protein|uniref:hypothetical protein n=1 Tax=Luteibacter sp. TaxID=1886636 RepID=UPI002F40A44F
MDMNPLHIGRPLLRRLCARFTADAAVHYDRTAGTIVFHPERFRMREVPLDSIVRVEAGNRDDLPDVSWETVFLFFHIEGGEVLAVSERVIAFAALVSDLKPFFPRIMEWQQAVPSVQFHLTSVDLWTRVNSAPFDESGDVASGADWGNSDQ